MVHTSPGYGFANHTSPGYGFACKTGLKRPEQARPLIRPCLKLHGLKVGPRSVIVAPALFVPRATPRWFPGTCCTSRPTWHLVLALATPLSCADQLWDFAAGRSEPQLCYMLHQIIINVFGNPFHFRRTIANPWVCYPFVNPEVDPV